MILIVGGTGFVGKNLVLSLSKRGSALRVVSRNPDTEFLSKHAPEVQSLTLAQLMSDPKAALLDVTTVVYLASTSVPTANLECPWREARDTVETTMRMISAVAKHSSANVIYLSSGGAIYGDLPVERIKEQDELRPISPYGLGKKMTEAALDFMARTQGLKVTVLRPSNPIGRWQVNVSQGVVGAMMRAARKDTIFPMFGEGAAVRDYFDIRDLSAAIELILDQPELCFGRTWNVGSGTGISVQEILKMVQEVSGREIRVNRLPARPADVARTVLDTAAIQAELGWRPRYELRGSLHDIWKVT
ncbi:NAD-dependent epimerase/dehydratase family protein [uncultured Litoreibacter sp.]|uniref:NAD-dependent epimerase/dehydratase family protein n=1 Tax=uncultured Litoreibacter sp. TaxID=1392394 RepID=UPI0026309887|nr:NAD-dependent epimerase/dehydratase family protein [uncultured Litoreibacter sp.]